MPPFGLESLSNLLEQAEHALAGLRGERQRGGRELLAGLQREQVGAFLVGIGEGEAVGAGLQRVDHRLGEVLADLHRRQVGAERLGLATQRGQRGCQVGGGGVDVGVGSPRVGSGRDSEAGGRVGHARHGHRRGAAFVEDDRQVVAGRAG